MPKCSGIRGDEHVRRLQTMLGQRVTRFCEKRTPTSVSASLKPSQCLGCRHRCRKSRQFTVGLSYTCFPRGAVAAATREPPTCGLKESGCRRHVLTGYRWYTPAQAHRPLGAILLAEYVLHPLTEPPKGRTPSSVGSCPRQVEGTHPTTRSGPPLPPSIFIGNATIPAPVVGSRPRCARFSNPTMFLSYRITCDRKSLDWRAGRARPPTR